ncbi:MAG TPA: biosynthetic-type acetolactate synthase large subunit [Treponema sp.]|nr:MAG: acetolactate synthase, large subunit, biosynthetic type [Treponema sp. GWC1_61_84]HCM28310.1 biosynthetic-type acetolactate synthase large subunit [Treponema sp.]
MEMNGAEIIMGILEREGIETVAGIPGGSNLPLYHALGASRVRHILARHEQAAGFIAQGLARRSGKVAVCFATSGPGVTNLLTAIADAKLDSVPVVAITGQVPRLMLGTDAFQEIDTYGLSIPITKHSVLVKSAKELLTELPRAFRIARSGRPGPVVVDVPKDVQTERISFDAWPAPSIPDPNPPVDEETIEEITREILKADRPLVYAGAGCASSSATAAALADFARAAGIPVTATLLGRGCFPVDDALWLGMLGMHGSRAANAAVAECDLLLAIGARFDDRATGKLARFAPRARVVHIDIDAAELGKLRKPVLGMRADAGDALRAMTAATGTAGSGKEARRDWLGRIAGLKAAESLPCDAEEGHPVRFLAEVSDLLAADDIVVTDVGQHQMWAAQAIETRSVRSFLTSGGLGTMGFGLPAAIGAALASPASRVLCVTGDGSLLMNIQELATLAELDANVAVLLLDNGKLGLVRQQQELFYEGRYTASHFDHRPDFAAIAAGFGLRSIDLERSEDPPEALRAALEEHGPVFIRVRVDPQANVWPMVPPGAANEDAVGDYGSVGETEEGEEESA